MTKNLIILFLIVGIQLQAQDFDNIVSALGDEIKTVQSAKKEYIQSIKIIQPGVVNVTIEEVNSKGSNSVKNYEFNTADIDINTIKTITKKDVIQVQLLANRKQKLIKLTTNHEKISFINQLFIYAENIDNGREIVENFKKCVPLAKKITNNRLSLTTYIEYLDWLENNVGDVNLIKKQFLQNLSVNKKFPGSIVFKSNVNSGKISKNYTYLFNLATINPNSILFKIEGEIFYIELETRRKLKTIKYFEEQEQKNYINKFKIVCPNVENARDLQKVLKDLIPLAQKTFNDSLTSITSIKQGIDLINSTTNEVIINDLSIHQNISGDCVIVFEQETLDNDKTTTEIFSFNIADLNKNGLNYKSNGKLVYLELFTKGGNKFIKHEKNGEQENYTKKLKIYTPEIEDAIGMKNILSTIIDLCQKNNEYRLKKGSQKELLNILQQNIKNVVVNNLTYDQRLEIDEENNSLKFISTVITSKSSKEKVSEFNLSDINSGSIKMETSGKNVIVTANTYYLEKIIKYYEDGKIKNYKNTILIQANNIENARLIKHLLKELTKNKSHK